MAYFSIDVYILSYFNKLFFIMSVLIPLSNMYYFKPMKIKINKNPKNIFS